MSKIEVSHIYKIFGPHPDRWLKVVQDGMSKEELLTRSGHTLGLRDISLSIDEGSIHVIMGLSGSGKSTLIRHFNRLIEPTSGEIRVDGQNVVELGRRELAHLRQQKMSMVFQRFGLFPHRTVLDNAAYGLAVQKVPRAQREEKARYWLDQVGLSGFEHQYPHQLSGGMQQRVGLARALATDAEILLMDEAFSALDPIIRTEMQSELLRLQEIKRRTIVFISHDLDEAMRIGDRIAIMKDGMVQQVGTPDEILRNPANDYVRTFIQGVDAAAVFKASDIARQALTVISEHSDRGCRAALRLLEDSDRDYAYVLNARKRFLGVVSSQSLRDALHGHEGMLGLKHAFISDVQPIASSTPVAELFGTVATPAYPLPVVDEEGKYLGVISRTTMLKFLDRATPPVPPPQKEIPPIKLDQHFQPKPNTQAAQHAAH